MLTMPLAFHATHMLGRAIARRRRGWARGDESIMPPLPISAMGDAADDDDIYDIGGRHRLAGYKRILMRLEVASPRHVSWLQPIKTAGRRALRQLAWSHRVGRVRWSPRCRLSRYALSATINVGIFA